MNHISTDLGIRIRKTATGFSGLSPLQLDEAAQVIGLELARANKNIQDKTAELISAIKLGGDYGEVSNFLVERPVRIVTTNYDKLAEEVASKDCQSLSPGQPIPRSDARVKVYHIHGSVDVPARMVITADDYFNFLQNETYFSRKLSTILHENTVLILGYSLGDVNLKSILNEYRGFVRSHVITNSIFFVSRKQVNQRVADYYFNSYGIRVISNIDINDFFGRINKQLTEAIEVKRSMESITKIINDNRAFSENYLKIESVFYEIISGVAAVGASLHNEKVVEMIADIIVKKKNLAIQPNAWEQYTQLAAWLSYLGSLIDVRGTALEARYLDAVKWSMEHMSRKQIRGFAWQAFEIWNKRWSGITLDNRALICGFIKANSSDPDAREITSRT